LPESPQQKAGHCSEKDLEKGQEIALPGWCGGGLLILGLLSVVTFSDGAVTPQIDVIVRVSVFVD
jgi:hypothetical protein